MTEYAKPLPDPSHPAAAAFWAGTRESRLLIQRCAACGYLRWPPGPACPECLSWEAEWTQVRPTGTLITYCVYQRALSKAFAADIPYAVGYVQLDDGPRMYGTMTGDPSALSAGLPVRAFFESVTPEVTLVRWTVTAAAAPTDPASAQETRERTQETRERTQEGMVSSS